MGSDPGVPLEEVCPIPGMPMPKDGYIIPSDAPGFGMENQGRVGSAVGSHRGDEDSSIGIFLANLSRQFVHPICNCSAT